MAQGLPYIPESITVHLGPPGSNAENVTLPFSDYLKNVASSEIYPTWPEEAIRANVLAEGSFALNRVYTEYYRSRGYDYDITNSTAADQSFVKGREIFENVSRITDELFTSYLSRRGDEAPLFAAYCDGRAVTCDGLSQWGSVELANAGYSAEDIIKTYYGRDVEIVSNVPVEGFSESYPGSPLRIGDSGDDVFTVQVRLGRIRRNYPLIPPVTPDGEFGEQTEAAVRAFQRIFYLDEDGVVGRGTWYKIAGIWNAVKRLSDLNSEGVALEEIFETLDGLSVGSTGARVRELQYLLSYIAEFDESIPKMIVDGIFGERTRDAVASFQAAWDLPVTGEVDEATSDALFSVYRGILMALPEEFLDAARAEYPGAPLSEGYRGDAASTVQEFLNFIAEDTPSIRRLAVDGDYGPQTAESVRAFQRAYGLPVTGVTDAATWAAMARAYRESAAARLRSAGTG
ncbi:MAG: peptidoglycan-binding protein [Clostridia bacterium]|nr:peptidoglycan-binding protein [Clostridia bacterium]